MRKFTFKQEDLQILAPYSNVLNIHKISARSIEMFIGNYVINEILSAREGIVVRPSDKLTFDITKNEIVLEQDIVTPSSNDLSKIILPGDKTNGHR